MENNNSNNSKNIIIGVLVVLVIALEAYIGYDKFLSKDKENTNITDSSTNDVNSDNDTNSNVIDNNYEIFKNNFIKNRQEYYDSSVKNKHYFERDSRTNILLDKDGNLYYSKDNEKVTIATNVLNYEFLYTGNGGQKFLYFIKEDGTVSCARGIIYILAIDTLTFNKDNMDIQNNVGGYKNIIGFIEGIVSYCGDVICDDVASPIFVDINGNMYNINFD